MLTFQNYLIRRSFYRISNISSTNFGAKTVAVPFPNSAKFQGRFYDMKGVIAPLPKWRTFVGGGGENARGRKYRLEMQKEPFID